MKTSEEIRTLADEMEKILKENEIARPNPNAVRRIQSVESMLRARCNYCGAKAGKLANLAERFYSERKHETHRDGPNGIWRKMRSQISQIRAQADHWESQGK